MSKLRVDFYIEWESYKGEMVIQIKDKKIKRVSNN